MILNATFIKFQFYFWVHFWSLYLGFMFDFSVSFYLYHYQNIFVSHKSYLGSQAIAHYSFLTFLAPFTFEKVVKWCLHTDTQSRAARAGSPQPPINPGSPAPLKIPPHSPYLRTSIGVSHKLIFLFLSFVVLTHVRLPKTNPNKPKPKSTKLSPTIGLSKVLLFLG